MKNKKKLLLIAILTLLACLNAKAREPRRTHLEEILQYVVEYRRTDDGSADRLTFRSDLPVDLIPVPGDVFICKNTEKTPCGMCHKVTRERKGMTFGLVPLTWKEMMSIKEIADVNVNIDLNALLDDNGRGGKIIYNWIYDPKTGAYIQKGWRYDQNTNSYVKSQY